MISCILWLGYWIISWIVCAQMMVSQARHDARYPHHYNENGEPCDNVGDINTITKKDIVLAYIIAFPPYTSTLLAILLFVYRFIR